jgi:predicted transcriptional regulator of viral defense system
MTMTKLDKLLRSPMTVFGINDLSALWGQGKRSDTVQSAKHYVKTGQMFRLRRGLYSTVPEPDPLTVANKLLSPSYVSGLSALIHHGFSFQFAHAISSVATVNKNLTLGSVRFEYRKLKDIAFFNRVGIIRVNELEIAAVERAVADLLYFNEPLDIVPALAARIDFDKIVAISGIYDNEAARQRALLLRSAYA